MWDIVLHWMHGTINGTIKGTINGTMNGTVTCSYLTIIAIIYFKSTCFLVNTIFWCTFFKVFINSLLCQPWMNVTKLFICYILYCFLPIILLDLLIYSSLIIKRSFPSTSLSQIDNNYLILFNKIVLNLWFINCYIFY